MKPILALVFALLISLPLRAGERPNIIVILADDLGWRDLGCYGSAFYEMPHVDRLARGLGSAGRKLQPRPTAMQLALEELTIGEAMQAADTRPSMRANGISAVPAFSPATTDSRCT